MKRILSLWLAAAMFAVQPCYAAVCVGFGASAACDDGLLSNGCFDDGTTDWEKSYNSTSLVMEVTSGQMVFTLNEFSYEGIKQAVTLTNSASYTLTMDIIAMSGGATPGIQVLIGGTDCGTFYEADIGTGKSKTCNAGTADEIKIAVGGASPRSFTIDNVKLTAN